MAQRYKSLIFSAIFSTILLNDAHAYRCKETSCSDIRVGLGAFHSNFKFNYDNGSKAEYNNTGGYLSIYAGKYWKWAAFDTNINLGIGSSNVFNNNLLVKNYGGFIGVDFSIGTNLGSLKTPILLLLTVGSDGYDLAWRNREHKLGISMPFIGTSVAGLKTINKNIDIEYSLRYGYIFGGAYEIHAMSNKSFLNGGHRIEASIGMLLRQDMSNLSQFEIDRKLDFYIQLKGIYRNVNASDIIIVNSKAINYPANNSFAILFEFGIASHLNSRFESYDTSTHDMLPPLKAPNIDNKPPLTNIIY